MLKKIALAAMAAATASVMAQSTTQTTTTTTTNQGVTTQQTATTTSGDWGWRQKYDTYHIASVDVNGISSWDKERILRHDLKDINQADAFCLTNFLTRIPSDQEYVLVKALVNNYKMASAVRDEVAMARFGSASPTYTWMSYPALTWSDTPGQNSWTSVTMADNGTMTTTMTTDSDYDSAVAVTDDQFRPMRMLMAHRNERSDIDYYRAVDILNTGLDATDQGQIVALFHPRQDDPNSFINEQPLDAIIHLIQSNANMVHELNRYSWYNHYDPGYYSETWRWQD
jgi:hypothetical protein